MCFSRLTSDTHTHFPQYGSLDWIEWLMLWMLLFFKWFNCCQGKPYLGTFHLDNSEQNWKKKTREKEVGWRGEGMKTGKQNVYKKQIAKHKHQSVDRSRTRKLDSQELENASMREKKVLVSMIHCILPATVGWGNGGGKNEKIGRRQRKIERETRKTLKGKNQTEVERKSGSGKTTNTPSLLLWSARQEVPPLPSFPFISWVTIISSSISQSHFMDTVKRLQVRVQGPSLPPQISEKYIVRITATVWLGSCSHFLCVFFL